MDSEKNLSNMRLLNNDNQIPTIMESPRCAYDYVMISFTESALNKPLWPPILNEESETIKVIMVKKITNILLHLWNQ